MSEEGSFETDLEMLKEIFKTEQNNISLGRIVSVHPINKDTNIRVKVDILDDDPDNPPIFAKMTWEQVGPESGFICFPAPGDLCLVAYAQADVDYAFVVKN